VGPSIKTENDRLALWQAVSEGLIDTIGSDHAPKDKKVEDDFFNAPYGSPEVETMLPVVWHFGVNSGYITPNEIAGLLSERSSRIMGLFPQKGRLDIGSDADMVIFDPTEDWTVTNDNQHSNATYTLFEGMKLLGRVRSVLSRGETVFNRGEYMGTQGRGKFLPTSAGRYR
jgi:dihydroorotase-like cyclic amidohydrolase